MSLKHRVGYLEGSLCAKNLLDPFSRFDALPRLVTSKRCYENLVKKSFDICGKRTIVQADDELV